MLSTNRDWPGLALGINWQCWDYINDELAVRVAAVWLPSVRLSYLISINLRYAKC